MNTTTHTHQSVHRFNRTHHRSDASEAIASRHRASQRHRDRSARRTRRTVWSTPRPRPPLARRRHPRRRIDDARARSRRRNSSPTPTQTTTQTTTTRTADVARRRARTSRDATETPHSANARHCMRDLSQHGIFGSPRVRHAYVLDAHVSDQSTTYRTRACALKYPS